MESWEGVLQNNFKKNCDLGAFLSNNSILSLFIYYHTPLLVTPLGQNFTEGLELEMCFFKIFIPPLSESEKKTIC